MYTYENCGNSTEKTIQCDIIDNKAELNDVSYFKKNSHKISFRKIS